MTSIIILDLYYFVLSCEQIEGLDIVGFHRELGQLYISTMENKLAKSRNSSNSMQMRKDMQMRRDIPACFKLIVEAGVSIELIDGDTTNMNKEIIIKLLDLLNKS